MASPPYRVLHVVANSSEACPVEVALSHVRDAAFEAERVPRLADAVLALEARSFDAVIVSLDLPDSACFTVRDLIAVAAGRTPVLVIATPETEAEALLAVQAGTIDVESTVGEGTAFDIRFPTVDEAVQEIAAIATVSGGARGETVLLVEDEDVLRALGVRILRRLGYIVLDARNGVEALAAGERHAGTIDLLLTDVIMPEMSGTELAGRLAQLRPGLRVLYVSGYTEDFTSRHGALNEGQSLLEKPFTPSSLGRRVREVLDGAGAPVAA